MVFFYSLLHLIVFLINSNEIRSNKVAAHGDALAMVIYAVSLTPLTM